MTNNHLKILLFASAASFAAISCAHQPVYVGPASDGSYMMSLIRRI